MFNSNMFWFSFSALPFSFSLQTHTSPHSQQSPLACGSNWKILPADICPQTTTEAHNQCGHVHLLGSPQALGQCAMQQIKLIHRDKVNKGPDADKLRQLSSSPPVLGCFLWVASGDIVHKTVMRQTDSERAKDAASFEGS